MSTTTGNALLEPGSLQGALRARIRSWLFGAIDEPVWARPALAALLALTAALYLVDLSISGYANAFYSAAVEAATKSWKAFFFGSFDSSNFITVDKPPASLWVMDLSARIFGFSSWSVLAPQALEGVAAVGLLYATVRRRFGPAAGLLAGLTLAITPVAALMFRFNNPDALLTLVLVASAYALTRALERGSTGWLVLAGSLIGTGFLTKMLQGLIVVPGFAAVYLLAAPTPLRRRIVSLLASGAALLVSAGWWVAVVALWPASSRPYIGGSQDNSILNLIFGYNGFGRITGNETGSVVGGRVVSAGQAGMWGPTGIWRLFGDEMGTQISWLLPAALMCLVAVLWARRSGPRTDSRRAAVILFGSWLLVTGLVFSFAQGIIHPYYTVALAPAIAALVGIGVSEAWCARERLSARLGLASATAATAAWAAVMLERTPSWLPWLRPSVLAGGLVAAVLLAAGPRLWRRLRLPALAVLAVALAAALATPAAYAVETASQAHSGSLPTAGPAGASTQAGPGGGGPRGGVRSSTGSVPAGGPRAAFGGGANAAPSSGSSGFGQGPSGGFAGFAPGGGAAGIGGFRPGGRFAPAGGGALGGLLQAGTPGKALVRLLESEARGYTWVAATVGSQSAAGVELATDDPVMAIGGFNGTDPTPTLAEFEADVRAGRIHYYLGESGGGQGGSASSEAIAAWVESHFSARTVDGVSVYDLASATAAS